MTTAPDIRVAAEEAWQELRDHGPIPDNMIWDLLHDAFITGFINGFVFRGEQECPSCN